MPGHFLIFPKSRWLVLSILLFSYLPDLNAQTINTFAGDRTGDGGPATSAFLGSSLGIALDRHGNLYIADPNNHRIRKVNTSEGTISTIAGTGQAGYNGDGKLATRATLSYPSDIAFDTLGNLYIADRDNRRIRKVNGIDGTISTVVGNGFYGYNGDGGLATEASLIGPQGITLDTNGNIYFSEGNNVVRKVEAANGIINTIAGTGWYGFEGDGGPATQARLAGPSRLVTDTQGNLLIADTNNHRIRKVDRNSGIISTIAGNGNYQHSGDGGPAINAGMQGPTGIGLDAAGNLFVSERFGYRVRKININDGIIKTIAGNGSYGFVGDGGSPLQASLASPADVAVSPTGILYIADQGNHRIRRINADGNIISSIAGYGYLQSDYCGDGYMASSSCLNQPEDVAVDTLGNVYIADKYNFVIRKVSRDGIITTIAGNGSYGFSGDGGPAIKATLKHPNSVAVDRAGNIFIADQANYRVRKVAAADGIITTVAGNGNYEHSGDGGPAINASLRSVSDIALDAYNNLYILDLGRVRKVNAESGIITTIAGNGINGYNGDGGLAINASLNYPLGIALDNTGNLYIADRQNHRVRRVDALTGIITTIAGTGTNGFSGDGGPATSAGFSLPNSIWVDAGGNIFITDQGNARIRKITRQDGLVKTIAGNGIRWFAGDGGPATDASLYNPEGIAVDKAGTIYIADTQNHRIRAVSQTIISLKNGSWADPAVWNLGRIPTVEDHVIVDQNHTIMVTDQAVTKGIEYRANAQILFSGTASSIEIGQ